MLDVSQSSEYAFYIGTKVANNAVGYSNLQISEAVIPYTQSKKKNLWDFRILLLLVFAKWNTASVCNFIKKETLSQVFSCEFWEIFKSAYFVEHLRMAASLAYHRT